MTRDEIISMAREAGFNATVGKTTNGKYHPNVSAISKSIPVEWMERFAAMVEARAVRKERKECMSECQALADFLREHHDTEGAEIAEELVKNIRARSKKGESK